MLASYRYEPAKALENVQRGIEHCSSVKQLEGVPANVTSQVIIQAVVASDGAPHAEARVQIRDAVKRDVKSLLSRETSSEMEVLEKLISELKDKAFLKCVVEQAAQLSRALSGLAELERIIQSRILPLQGATWSSSLLLV